MLGQPIAQVAPTLGMAGQVQRVAEGLGGVAALNDRRRVQDGEGDHRVLEILVEMGSKAGDFGWNSGLFNIL